MGSFSRETVEKSSPRYLPDVYPKRTGFADAAGVQFERLLSALLFLRAHNRTDSFELVQNMDDVGDFDDNVLFCHNDESTVAYFVQQKHYQKEERSEEDVIGHLLKYYLSYQCIHKKFKVDELEVIFYTNSQLSKVRQGEQCCDHILSTGGFRFQYTFEDHSIQSFFSELIKYHTFLCTLCKGDKHAIEEQVTQKKAEFKCLDIKNKLGTLETKPSPEKVKQFIKEVEELVDENKFKGFLDHLNVFHCQTRKQDQFMELIQDEFHKACGTNEDMDVDNIIKLFMDNIEKWSIEKNESHTLTASATLWKEVMTTLMNHLNSIKLKELGSLGIHFNETELENCRAKLQCSDSQKIIVNTSCTSLSLLKIHEALKASEPHLILSGEAVQNHLATVIQICQSEWCSALLVGGIVTPKVLKILRQTAKKLFIVASTGSFTKKTILFNDSCNLSHLDEISEKSLKEKVFIFQGYKTCLQHFIIKYPHIVEIVCGDVLEYIISSKDPIEVGRELQSVVNYYIPRTLLQKRYIKKEIIRSKEPSALFAFSMKKMEFNKMMSSYSKSQKKHIKRSKGGSQLVHVDKIEETWFKEFLVASGQNGHLLRKDKNGLYWKWSNGEMNTIRYFIDPLMTKRYETSSISNIPADLILIIAEPGMGKTTLLNAIAHQIKKADPSKCILRINLINHSEILESGSLNKNEQVEFFKEVVISGKENIFESELLKYVFHNSLDLVILIDGFDEISPYYADGCIRLIKCLQKENGGKLWITSRSVLNERLQDELSTLPFTLEPFSTSDQKNFLKKYWKSENIKPNELEKFVTEVLEVMKKSLVGQDIRLAEIPLQTMLIAEAFGSAYSVFKTSGEMHLPNQLDLIELYESFIEVKYNIYLTSREGNSPSQAAYKKHFSRCVEENNEKHCILALALLLSEKDLNLLKNFDILKKHDALVDEAEEIARVGIVSFIHDGKACFVHRTFAEYFLALWLINHLQEMRQFLLKKLFDPSFSFVLKWFDQMLVKECKIHKAVLINDEYAVQEILPEYENMEQRDDGGRTPVHLASMFGRSLILRLLLKNGWKANTTDEVLGWTPIQYADHTESWECVEILLQNGADGKDLQHLRDIIKKGKDLIKVMTLSSERGYYKVIEFILSYGVKIDKMVDCEGFTLLHKAAKYGHTKTFSYLVCYEARMKVCGKILWPSVLSLSVSYPEILADYNVKLYKGKVNVENFSGHTPLDLAITGGHMKTAQWILNIGGDINHRDGMGYTQLHWAVQTGCTAKIERILSFKADVNQLNAANQTPLHLAVTQHTKEHGSTLNLRAMTALLTAGANMYFEDNSGLTPIHWASVNTKYTVLLQLIKYGAYVNETDRLGSSALHWAAWRGNCKNVTTLLQAGALCNATNTAGNTPLHWAAAQGHATIVCQLLLARARVNVLNNNGCTPMCMALKSLDSAVISQLIRARGQACDTCLGNVMEPGSIILPAQ